MPKIPTPPRPLYHIASEIMKDWGDKVNYAARPYLEAMAQLGTVDQNFGYDSGRSVVRYFLSNAGSWRGETARRIKAELKEMVK